MSNDMILTARRVRRTGGSRVAALAVTGALAAVGGHAALSPIASATASPPAVGAETAPGAPLLEPAVYAGLTGEEQAAVDRIRERFGDEFLAGVPAPVRVGEDGRAPEARAQMINPAGWFAQELFSWGLGMGFDAFADAIGVKGEGPVMAEINAALADIDRKVDAMQAELERLADSVVWNAFADAHTESEEEANEILQEATLIADLELLGVDMTQPKRHGTINQIVNRTRDAMTDLGPTLLTRSGTGSVPALLALERHAVPVSDTEESWERTLAGVERYRATYAQGVMNVMWAAQYDEAHDEIWGVLGQNSADAANRKITEIYDFIGAPYPQRPQSERKWVHVNGADWAMASMTRDPYLDEQPEPLIAQGTAQPKLQALAGYRQHDGPTLQSYLTDRGFTHTTFTYVDQYGYEKKCPWSCNYSVHRHLGAITGNGYSRNKHVYWEFSSSRHESDVYNDHIKPNIEQNQQIVRENPRIAAVEVPVNPNTGMPALMDEESIRAQRDGLKDLEIQRGEGDAVRVSFVNSGYSSLHVVPLGRDDPVATIDLRHGYDGTGIAPVPTREGVELRLGHVVDGDVAVQDTRATSVVAASPGASRMVLDLDVVEVPAGAVLDEDASSVSGSAA